ncbi:hypothetical protein DDR33_23555 [Pararcticibacter amylolyticus]|uniref:Type II toxin-antitoxin system RelE/ParE family toxin n=1 Tax=Pararcticibacter amylolyticus TaxID=2173175 RepID=A0A2U2P9W2_9SPHI|nr:hypothetical protein DDR33_23555 [Pararcticibacter amylolyticus]
MSYSVIWSPTARITYYHVLEYLNEKWTVKEIEAFISRTEKVINYICENPLLYPYSKESDTHKCVVVFWDNRQDPANLLYL